MNLFKQKKNNQGFTVIELVVSFALAMIVIVFLFQILVQVKELYVAGVIKTELLTKQANITKTISSDITKKKILYATNCGKYCLNFTFEDNSTSQLKVDTGNKVIRYGSYAIQLAEGSKIGQMRVTTETPVTTSPTAMMGNNSFIRIDIPITHHLLKEDFGIRLVYQYNNYETALNNIVFEGNGQKEYLYLRGLEEMVLYNTIPYQEPGWFVIDENGNQIENDGRVSRVCNVGSTIGQTYTCTYSFYDNGKLINERKRKVTIIPSTSDFQYTGTDQVFIPSVTGNYQIELWGAQGGTTNASYPGGKGAYTSGQVKLNSGENLYLYVGGTTSNSTGGYNGGGNGMLTSGVHYSGGGGATDVRLIGGPWNDAGSLKSRIMVAAGGAGGYYYPKANRFSKSGAAGGGLTGEHVVASNTCTSYGGTQTAGGKCDLNSSVNGGFGYGGNAFGAASSGGGSGYYGGAGRYDQSDSSSAGGGGSSFISGYAGCNAVDADGKHTGSPNHYSGRVFVSGKMVAGNASMPNPTGGTMTGRAGNGYARITLKSITTSN